MDKTLKLKDGRKLGYIEYGDVNGNPLFFFHGWPSSRFQASIFDNKAKEFNIRVISVDRPGYGMSSPKPKRTLLDWPDDVCELADYLHIKKFSTLGNSGGGPYSAVCGYKIPERIEKVGISVGLAPVYINGILEGMPFVNKFAWANYSKMPWLKYVGSYMLLIELTHLNFLTRLSYGAKVDRYAVSKLKGYEMNNKEAFRQGIIGVLSDLNIYCKDWEININDISVPTYLWYGEADKNVPIKMGYFYEKQLPNVTAFFYKNEGHTLILNHIDEVLGIFKLQ